MTKAELIAELICWLGILAALVGAASEWFFPFTGNLLLIAVGLAMVIGGALFGVFRTES